MDAVFYCNAMDAEQHENRRRLEAPRKTQQHLELLTAHLQSNIVLIPCRLHLNFSILLHDYNNICNFCGLAGECSFVLLGQIDHGFTMYKFAEGQPPRGGIGMPYKLCHPCFDKAARVLTEYGDTKLAGASLLLLSSILLDDLKCIVWEYLYAAKKQCPFCDMLTR